MAWSQKTNVIYRNEPWSMGIKEHNLIKIEEEGEWA